MTAPLESDVPTFQAPPQKRLEYIPGQIVVRVHEDALRPTVGAGRLSLGAETAEALPEAVTKPLDLLTREAGALEAEPLFTPRRARAPQLSRHHRVRLAAAQSVAESESEDLAGLTVIEVPQRDVSAQLLRRVASSPAIAFAELIPARWLSAAVRADPKRNRQWGLRAIRWFDGRHPNARSVTVAVLDTGVDENHPDLAAALAAYDHPGVGGRDLIGHGTHVSGIIGARTNNDAGITGIASCRMAMWKVFADEPYGGDFYVDGTSYLRALNAVAASGAKVLNLSLGGTASSQAEQLLFDRLDRFGVTVVAAMGNEFDDGNPVEYPSAYDGVLAVGAVAETSSRSPFSNTGRHIGIAAPGSNILSTVPTTRSKYRPETRYATWSGTSMATPHVAAAAALLAAQHESWTPSDLKEQLRRRAGRLPDMRGKDWTQAYGNGLLDVASALSSD
jgi:subtilisin family serine protease